MSRIGKLPITIPENVNVNYNDSEIKVTGKFGTLQKQIPNTIQIQQDKNILKISLNDKARNMRQLNNRIAK